MIIPPAPGAGTLLSKHSNRVFCVLLFSQAQDDRLRYTMSTVAEATLREDLKRSQEALMGLSAWDEEKIELEMEVRY